MAVLLGISMVFLALAVFNLVASHLEQEGQIETSRGYDDHIRYVDQSLFALASDGWYHTTPYAHYTMVPSRFRGEKGKAWRAFILGGSFAMGSEYVHQQHNEERDGGIASWLRADLAAMAPQQVFEVINAAAGAQNSGRVALVAETVLELEPDLLIVATGNNEGVLPPSEVEVWFRQFSGFRWASRLAHGVPDSSERSYYTPQDPDTQAITRAFESNLTKIIASAEKRGVRVLLCTLPVNLRYADFQHGHVITPAGPLSELGETCPDCRRLFESGQFQELFEHVRSCDHVESLRFTGLAYYRLGEFARSRILLEQYTEIMPRNRCRPSFNDVIRRLAVRHHNVALVDLATAADALSPGGIPGPEIFTDYCHMNWQGYAQMADEILSVMQREKVGPWWDEPLGHRPTREDLAKRFGLLEQDAGSHHD